MSRLALAAADGEQRFVFVILRGALDGLTAVPPVGDPAYAGLRREIAVPPAESASPPARNRRREASVMGECSTVGAPSGA